MPPPSTTSTTTLRVALDWTPNTLHTGLFLADRLGYYASAGLSVTFLTPSFPSSPSSPTPITPARLLASGGAELAVCPSESCVAYAESGKVKLQAIYAVCGEDASAIATRPRGPDGGGGHGHGHGLKELGSGGKYGSYGARYEDEIVREMVRAAGGDGAGMKVVGVDAEGDAGGATSLWKRVVGEEGEKGVDATWVFVPWEGVEADMAGVPVGLFRPGEYGVPYGYSPVICRDSDGAVAREALEAFVRETARGYGVAVTDVGRAVEVMLGHVEGRGEEFLRRSQESVNRYYGSRKGDLGLGRMEEGKWQSWVDWLRDKGLVKKDIELDELFTNQFFVSGE